MPAYHRLIIKGLVNYSASIHTFKTSFLHGCVSGLILKIKEAEKQSAEYAQDKALMVLKNAAVNEWINESMDIKDGPPVRAPKVSQIAYHAGVQQGRTARIFTEFSENNTGAASL